MVGLDCLRLRPASARTLCAGRLLFPVFWQSALSALAFLPWLAVLQEAWTQLTFFSIFSVVASLLFRKPLMARFGPKLSDEAVDSLVGESATVLDDIQVNGFGKVELRGTTWNARNGADRALSRGERCRVERVEGLSLWVRTEES